MSTRTQIEFQNIWKNEKGKIKIERRTVYRHSDGYPEAVIPDLKEFLKWNNGRNSDIEYQAANFIYWSKRRHEELYFLPKGSKERGLVDNTRKKWSDFGSTNCSMLHTGFGICENDEFHGDIEYFYEVIHSETNTIVIKAYEVQFSQKALKRKDFKLIKEVKVNLKEN